jgi:hypothetical protein
MAGGQPAILGVTMAAGQKNRLGKTLIVDNLTVKNQFATEDTAQDIAGRLVANGTNVINFAGTDPSTEVNGSMITTISTWVVHTAAGACALKILASSTATTGQYATIRPRARSDAAVRGKRGRREFICVR